MKVIGIPIAIVALYRVSKGSVRMENSKPQQHYVGQKKNLGDLRSLKLLSETIC